MNPLQAPLRRIVLFLGFLTFVESGENRTLSRLSKALLKTRVQHTTGGYVQLDLVHLVGGDIFPSQKAYIELNNTISGRYNPAKRLWSQPITLGQVTGSRQLKNKYGKGKGKGKEKYKGKKKYKKGKGGKKGGKSTGGGKGGKSKSKSRTTDDICRRFGLAGSAFTGRENNYPVSIFGKGKGKGRARVLQAACSPDAYEVLSNNPDVSIFLDLLEAVDLIDILSCPGLMTVLAPSNVAFEKNPDLLRSLFNPRNERLVRDMLLHHFVPDYLESSDFRSGPLETLLGSTFLVQTNPLTFNQAAVVEANIEACNAVSHIIEDPLIPDGKWTMINRNFPSHIHDIC